MRYVLLAGLGSFCGGAFRYLLSSFIQHRNTHEFPLGTFAVNIIGCFVIGCLFGLFQKMEVSGDWKVFLVTGVLGGFTTFSAFSVETFSLFRGGFVGLAFMYVLSSVVIGIGLTFLGAMIVGKM